MNVCKMLNPTATFTEGTCSDGSSTTESTCISDGGTWNPPTCNSGSSIGNIGIYDNNFTSAERSSWTTGPVDMKNVSNEFSLFNLCSPYILQNYQKQRSLNGDVVMASFNPDEAYLKNYKKTLSSKSSGEYIKRAENSDISETYSITINVKYYIK